MSCSWYEELALTELEYLRENRYRFNQLKIEMEILESNYTGWFLPIFGVESANR